MKEEKINVYHMCNFSGVSGSCHILVAKYDHRHEARILVDAGLHMGNTEEENSKLNYCQLPFIPAKVDAICITHAHSDHEGLLPLLVRKGFRGKIYTSKITARLLPIALEDCCKCLERDNEFPLYDEDDLKRTMQLIVPVENGVTIPIFNDTDGNNVNATFFTNGHLVGASSILVQFNGRARKQVNEFFSGDYKASHPLFTVPEIPEWCKLMEIANVNIESTYGNTDSCDVTETFAHNVSEAIKHGGTVLCPTLSLDRTELVLYKLRKMQDNRTLTTRVPIYLVGRLATRYIGLYATNQLGLDVPYDSLIPMHFCKSSLQEVKDKISMGEQLIVLAAPGMGQLGASLILEELLCSNPKNLVQYTSFVPANGIASEFLNATRGSTIVLRNGTTCHIEAEIKNTGEFSQHAKRDELLDFLEEFPNKHSVTISHGEPLTKYRFRDYILENGVSIMNRNNESSVFILDSEHYLRISNKGVDKVLNSKFLPAEEQVKKLKAKSKKKNGRKSKDR